MQKSRAWVEKIIAEKQVVYGVTTGVGSLSTEHIDPAAARELQLNVVRSHSCGVGEPLGAAETRGLLLLRANTLARGLSGVRPLIAETLCAFLNHGVHPIVPPAGLGGRKWRPCAARACGPGAGRRGRRRISRPAAARGRRL